MASHNPPSHNPYSHNPPDHNPFVHNGAGATSYVFTNAEAEALVARMSVEPNNTYKAAYDTLVGALKSGGIWSLLSAGYVMCGPDAQASRLDIVDLPGTGAYNLADFAGAPNHAAGRGFYCNGVDDALTTAWDPATNGGSLWAQNSAMLYVFARNPGQNTNIGAGLLNGTQVQLNHRNASDVIAARINSATATTASGITDGYGGVAIDRADSANQRIYKNGVLLSTVAATSAVRSSTDIGFGRTNSVYALNQFCFAFLGASLDDTKHAALHAAVAAFAVTVGLAAMPALSTSTIAQSTAATLPDGASGATAGKGWTNTGLARDPTDGTWWVGNDGRGLSGDPFLSSVVHVSSDFSTILADYTAASMSLAAASIQGVAYDTSDDTIWFLLKDTTPVVVNMSKAGSVIRSWTAPATTNGLAYDSLRDRIITMDDSGNVRWRNKSTGAEITGPIRRISSGVSDSDHLHYDAANDRLLITHGANGSAGMVSTWSIEADFGGPYRLRQDTLTGADAIEGLVLYNGVWYVMNDAYFHTGSPALNRVLTYAAP